jgi:hypothetical protein
MDPLTLRLLLPMAMALESGHIELTASTSTRRMIRPGSRPGGEVVIPLRYNRIHTRITTNINININISRATDIPLTTLRVRTASLPNWVRRRVQGQVDRAVRMGLLIPLQKGTDRMG